MPLLEGLDGVEKISEFSGNFISVNEVPKLMFKKAITYF